MGVLGFEVHLFEAVKVANFSRKVQKLTLVKKMLRRGLIRFLTTTNNELPQIFKLVTTEGLKETTLKDASKLLKPGEILKLVNPKDSIVRILMPEIKKKQQQFIQQNVRKEKEIELNSTIDPHDLEIKKKQICSWLEKKYLIKVSLASSRKISVDQIYRQLQGIHATFSKPARAGKKINFIMEYKKPL